MALLRMEKQIVLLLALLLCCPFFACAVPGTANVLPPSLTLFPCTNSGGSFDHTATVYSAKANHTLWANGTACGKYYCVVCTGGVDSGQPSPCRRHTYAFVIIEAECPDCEATMSISNDGFAAIADPNAGKFVNIDYAEIDNLDFPCA